MKHSLGSSGLTDGGTIESTPSRLCSEDDAARSGRFSSRSFHSDQPLCHEGASGGEK